MRIVLFIGLITIWGGALFSQTAPAHSYYDSPLGIDNGITLIDSTTYSVPDTIVSLSLSGRTSGNWYQLNPSAFEYVYLTYETLYTTGPFRTEIVVQNDEYQFLDHWGNQSVIKQIDNVNNLYYISSLRGYDPIKYRITRQDYNPNNPIDNIENAALYEIGTCLSANTSYATTTEINNPGYFIDQKIDVFYKFIAPSESIFQSYVSDSPLRYILYTNLEHDNYSRLPGEPNGLGVKYNLIKDSTYYIRILANDPFNLSPLELCLDVYDSDIHEEQDNFICSDARILSLSSNGGTMYIDSVVNTDDLIKNCQDLHLNGGQWYEIPPRDTTINYSLFADTSYIKIWAFSGSCSALECFDIFNYESFTDYVRIDFTIPKGQNTFLFLENIDALRTIRSVYFFGVPAPDGEICKESIDIIRDTTLTLDFAKAVYNYNSCNNLKKRDIWLSIKGNGKRVIIKRIPYADIFYYQGSCDSLSCVGRVDSPREYIQTEEGKDYKFSVSAFPGESIDLEISFIDPPINDEFNGAIILNCSDSIGAVFEGTTPISTCGRNIDLWYELPTSENSYELLLSQRILNAVVFTLVDGNFLCEETQYFQNRIVVSVTEGVRKFIGLSPNSTNSAFSTSVGISVNCLEPPLNDQLYGAAELFCQDSVTMNTLNSSLSVKECTSIFTYSDLWFKYNGSDQLVDAFPYGNYHASLFWYDPEAEDYECYKRFPIYVPQGDSLLIRATWFPNNQDSLEFSLSCTTMEEHRNFLGRKNIKCAEDINVDFLYLQDSLSACCNVLDAWFSLRPTGRVLSIYSSDFSRNSQFRLYRLNNRTLEEITFQANDNIELPDDTSEYIVQIISKNENIRLNFSVNCFESATNNSICAAIELDCQDTLKYDRELRLLSNTNCDEQGLPEGYWYKLSGDNRGVIYAPQGKYLSRLYILTKSTDGYDTLDFNTSYINGSIAYFDIEPNNEYYAVIPAGSASIDYYYDCLSSPTSHSFDNPNQFSFDNKCYEGSYLIGEDDASFTRETSCRSYTSFGPQTWFQYITPPDGIADLTLRHYNASYDLEIYTAEGEYLSCLSPLSSDEDLPYYVDSYIVENLDPNRMYMIKIMAYFPDVMIFSLCSNYDCGDSQESLNPITKSLYACPGIPSQVNISDYCSDRAYSLKANTDVVTLNDQTIHFNYPTGFGTDTLEVSFQGYCGNVIDEIIVISESRDNICDMTSCGRESIFLSDEVLRVAELPRTIHVRATIDGTFNINSKELFLHAGQEVNLFPNTSVNDQSLLEVWINECKDD